MKYLLLTFLSFSVFSADCPDIDGLVDGYLRLQAKEISIESKFEFSRERSKQQKGYYKIKNSINKELKYLDECKELFR